MCLRFIEGGKAKFNNLTKENVMKELISIAVLIAMLYGGTVAAGKIYCSV